jgi:hypothetical protein
MHWLRAPALGAAMGFAVAVAVILSGPDATAKTSYDSAYGFERTWNAGLRLVRVDLGLKVTEKDEPNGYLLFEYKAPDMGKKVSSGSMEFIRSKDPEAPIRVVVQLPEMPRYHEQMMVDELVKKMRKEYGDPPSRRPSGPPERAKDAGADGEAAQP